MQDLFRQYGTNDATFCKYNAAIGSMNVSDAKKLRTMEDVNTTAKQVLENIAPKNLAAQNY